MGEPIVTAERDGFADEYGEDVWVLPALGVGDMWVDGGESGRAGTGGERRGEEKEGP